MITLRSIEIKNYKCIKHTHLINLKDINIIIGPNNSGKTAILNAINILNKLVVGNGFDYLDKESQGIKTVCNDSQKKEFEIYGVLYQSHNSEWFNRKELLEITYELESSLFGQELQNGYDKILNKINYEDKKPTLYNHFISIMDERLSKLTIKAKTENKPNCFAVYINPFSIKESFEKKPPIILIDDNRLQQYKDKDPREYITKLNLASNILRKWLQILTKIVDKRIIDYNTNLELIKENDFITSIIEQGSGVRSLFCLIMDIVLSPEKSIILIDEPEIGLNHFAKQEFLKFIIEQAKTKQIFLTTHDNNFVNSFILPRDKTMIYMYSPIHGSERSKEPEEPNFIKVNLEENKEDPSIFGGYLPHTDSLKPIHIYVEGSKDVYKIQELLQTYLDSKKDKYKLINQIGIYHLGGTCWASYLYTLPGPPYKCVVILDYDKKSEVKQFCEKNSIFEYKEGIWLPKSYNNSFSNFILCNNLKEIMHVSKEQLIPIYCLNNKEVEKLESLEDENIKELFDSLIDIK